MKRPLSALLCFVVMQLGVGVTVWAGNAGWYLWESKIQGRFVCAQTSPGEGWKQMSGPFRDANCRKPR